jgi:hypothetical protein
MQKHLNIIQKKILKIYLIFYENNYKKLKENNDNDKYLQKQKRKMIVFLDHIRKLFKS